MLRGLRMRVGGLKRSFGCISRTTSVQPLPPRRKSKVAEYTEEYFADNKKVVIRGGKGGRGMMSFAHLPFNEFAGPDGGNGGHGAHVIFRADTKYSSLNHILPSCDAPPGQDGLSDNCYGFNAPHLYIDVPLGTLVKGAKDRNLIAELVAEGDFCVAARGGAGGRGNKEFTRADRQAPSIYEKGAKGQVATILLELKSIAHFGLVGFPNAGKSTLLRRVSRARPKVAAFPFTTLRPHVGVIEYTNYDQIFVADIPGIIPEAHEGKGLGIDFLRHIERCYGLIYVIDMTFDEPWNQYNWLRREAKEFKSELLERPSILVLNKMDEKDAKWRKKEFENKVGNTLPIFALSAQEGSNIKPLLIELHNIYSSQFNNHKKEINK